MSSVKASRKSQKYSPFVKLAIEKEGKMKPVDLLPLKVYLFTLINFCLYRQLCLLISSEDIFRSLSEILVSEIDVKFACLMVQTLNTILLTSTELYELRNQLKDLATRVSVVTVLNPDAFRTAKTP